MVLLAIFCHWSILRWLFFRENIKRLLQYWFSWACILYVFSNVQMSFVQW